MNGFAPRRLHLADGHELLAEGLQRLHDRLEDEVGALLIRMPGIGVDAIRKIDGAEAERPGGRGRQSRRHRVQKRQRDASAQRATQECAARKMLLRNEHVYSSLGRAVFAGATLPGGVALATAVDPPAGPAGSNFVRIWNGALSTMPRTMDDSP